VIGLEERDDHVVLQVRDTGSNETRDIAARYVVGCDGANSTIRKRVGLMLDDLEFDESWLVVDASVDKPRQALGLPGPAVQLCDPARPVSFIPVAGPYIRWEFMLRPGESKEEMVRRERVDELIAAWCDPRAVEVIRTAVYDFHALVAKGWNTRRVFLAGDSAHQMPPFLGQGMCSGIRDAANLAWKLRLVLSGGASEAILASYQSERDPHVRALIGVAIALGRIICTQDPEAAAARDAEFLSRGEREPAPPEMPGAGPGVLQSGCALAGKLGLQARVADGSGGSKLLDDVLGPRFALLTRAGSLPLSATAERLRARIDGRVVHIDAAFDLNGDYLRWLDRYGCDAILVRPDHIVFGTASGPNAPSMLLEELGAMLRPQS
jgi:3-(3-hydroxy-phenyl)propionate hydroxylase